MPGMRGTELAQRAREWAPGLRCLFVTGFPRDDEAGDALRGEGANVLLKPFGRQVLAARVRQILDAEESS